MNAKDRGRQPPQRYHFVCKNVVNTLPVIRAAFEELVEKAGVPCFIFYENNSDDVRRSGMELDLKHVKLARNVV